MAKTYARFTSTGSDGKVSSTTINNVNPDASNTQLVNFAMKLNALTTRDYNSTTRINEIDCDTESSKTTPIFTLSKTSVNYPSDFTVSGGIAKLTLTVTYNGDAGIGVSSAWPYGDYNCIKGSNNQYTININYDSDNFATTSFIVGFNVAETSNYKAASAQLIVNV